MGVVNTTYTFTGTDTITSSKLNNIIDDTTFTSDAISGSSLQIVSPGKLAVAAGGITSNELANDSVTSAKIVDGTIVNSDISASAAIAGTKISSNFGIQDITATGDLGLYGSSSDYTAASLRNTSGVETQIFAEGNAKGGLATTTNHPLTFITNNSEKMRISASGNVGVGTNNPSTPLDVKTAIHSSATGVAPDNSYNGLLRTTNSTASGQHINLVRSGNSAWSIGYVYNTNNFAIGPATATDSTFTSPAFVIAPSSNVGIGTTTPSTKLQVNGTVTATAFSGPLTGNVTGNVTGSSGSCTGNSATVTNGVYTNATNIITGSLNFNSSGTNTISNGTGDQATLSTYNLAIKSHWGIGFPSYDNINRIVLDTRTGGAQFSGTITAPTFSGNASSATTASTVSNSAITAAKLNGGQSGSAPIFGVRAWVTFDMTRDDSGASNTSNTNRYIYSSGNVSSVTKTADGSFTVNFTTAMTNANYAFFGGGRGNDSKGDIIIGEALLGAKSTSSIALRCVDSGNNDRNSSEISVAFIG